MAWGGPRATNGFNTVQEPLTQYKIKIKTIKWIYEGESGGLICVKLAKIIFNFKHW